MSVLTILYKEPVIDPLRIREVIDVTRVWLDIGEDRKVRQLAVLAPEEVLQALQTGERANWQGWSIKTTPPRRVGMHSDNAEWTTGIIAVSAYGFVSGLRVNPECIQRLCRDVMEIEDRRNRACGIEHHGRQAREWELEDG